MGNSGTFNLKNVGEICTIEGVQFDTEQNFHIETREGLTVIRAMRYQ